MTPNPGENGRSFRVAALALLRDSRVLMVARRGEDLLNLPAGTIDDEESPRDALVRMCREELAIEIDRTTVSDKFTVLVPARGELQGRMLSMTVYSADTDDEPRACGDVAAVYWATSADASRCAPEGADALAGLAHSSLID